MAARCPGLSTGRHGTPEATYEAAIRRYIAPRIGSLPLGRLSSLQVEQLLADLRQSGRLSEQTILHAFRVLRTACRQAVRWGVIDRDPTDAVRAPRPARFEAPTIGPEDARLILATFGGDAIEPAIALGLGGGQRRSEILGVRWGRIDLEAGSLRVEETLQPIRGRAEVEFCPPKSSSSRRTIALPIWCVEILRRHRAEQAARRLAFGEAWAGLDLVVERGDGNPIHPGELSRRFRTRLLAARKMAAREGLMPPRLVRLHDLRHAHATLLLAGGSPLKAISERLGHSTIGITANIYAHVLAELDRDAAARLDVMFGEGVAAG